MAFTRKDQKQIWADPEFIKKMNIISLEKKMKGEKANIGSVTKELAQIMEDDRSIRERLLKKSGRIKGVATDKKRLFG